jgi:hypothetical protein
MIGRAGFGNNNYTTVLSRNTHESLPSYSKASIDLPQQSHASPASANQHTINSSIHAGNIGPATAPGLHITLPVSAKHASQIFDTRVIDL